MPQLEHIEAIENRLWGAADNLRANSTYASNEYFLPVMGLVFLRYAYSRYLSVKDDIQQAITYYEDPHELLGKADYVMANPPFNVDEIDARNIYRQITRKIYDFSPEQQQNILAIIHLYRGETERFRDLISNYLQRILEEGHACFKTNDGETIHPLPDFVNALTQLHDLSAPSLKTLQKNGQHADTLVEYDKTRTSFPKAIEQFRTAIPETAPNTRSDLNKQVAEFAPLIEISRDLSERTDSLYKLAIRITDICETSSTINNRTDLTRARRTADETRQIAIEQLKQVHYFYQQAQWLTERFPEAKLCDVEGLVKLVDRAEIKANDWSLTPGRYVGVAPEEEDENFDFAETLREIHDELDELSVEAVSLAATIKRNFETLI